ncbi:hypothetical protein BJM39_31385 [Salmonella enterica subsp. enterica serovar Javiana]|nr:hypothetical protein BJM39_31385 [Salmonella enterica subsp. enterica serovar Javiana]
MTTTNRTPPTGTQRSPRGSTDLSRAWLAVASIPIVFFLAFALGEGLYALLGYQPEDATEPWWVALAAGVPAIALFLVPCVAAVWFGNRARTQGRRVAVLPMAVGAVLGLWMVVMNVVSLFAT